MGASISQWEHAGNKNNCIVVLFNDLTIAPLYAYNVVAQSPAVSRGHVSLAVPLASQRLAFPSVRAGGLSARRPSAQQRDGTTKDPHSDPTDSARYRRSRGY